MAKVSEKGLSLIGAALSDVMATALHKALLAVIPHFHNERHRSNVHTINALTEGVDATVGPLARHVLENMEVHPLLQPMLRVMANYPEDKTE